MTKNKKRSNSIISDNQNLKKKKINKEESIIIINKEIKSLDDLIELGLT